MFKIRGREVTEINRKQADLPGNCIALKKQKWYGPRYVV